MYLNLKPICSLHSSNKFILSSWTWTLFVVSHEAEAAWPGLSLSIMSIYCFWNALWVMLSRPLMWPCYRGDVMTLCFPKMIGGYSNDGNVAAPELVFVKHYIIGDDVIRGLFWSPCIAGSRPKFHSLMPICIFTPTSLLKAQTCKLAVSIWYSNETLMFKHNTKSLYHSIAYN